MARTTVNALGDGNVAKIDVTPASSRIDIEFIRRDGNYTYLVFDKARALKFANAIIEAVANEMKEE